MLRTNLWTFYGLDHVTMKQRCLTKASWRLSELNFAPFEPIFVHMHPALIEAAEAEAAAMAERFRRRRRSCVSRA